jgi:hypothetical protein
VGLDGDAFKTHGMTEAGDGPGAPRTAMS